MKFIEHHCIHAAQIRVRKKTPCEHALGHEPQPCTRASGFIEAHLVADDAANLLAHFRCNPAR